MKTEINNFYLNKEEPQKSIFMALREIVLRFDPAISEAWKYKMPCFCYEGKPFCYLWKDKKTSAPYVLIVKGDKIEHPGLIRGKRAKMKIFPIDVNEDIPIEALNEVLSLARALY
jgi:hypothetical protein